MRFLAAIAAAAPANETGDAFMEALLHKLASHLGAADRGVRFRAAQALAGALQALPAGACIEEGLAQQLLESLALRLRDKAGDVRQCAARALGRLPEADEVRRAVGRGLAWVRLRHTWDLKAHLTRPCSTCVRSKSSAPLDVRPPRKSPPPLSRPCPVAQAGSYADDPATCALIERLGQEKNKDVRAVIVMVRTQGRGWGGIAGWALGIGEEQGRAPGGRDGAHWRDEGRTVGGTRTQRPGMPAERMAQAACEGCGRCRHKTLGNGPRCTALLLAAAATGNVKHP